MYLFLFTSLILCILVFTLDTPDILSKFNQRDYKMKFERVVLLDYDKSVYDLIQGRVFKYNRTTTCVNFTVILSKNIEDEYIPRMSVIVQAYKFMSNEYRHFPIRFQVNYCKAFAANVVGIRSFLTCGNMSECPLTKGVPYHVCNFAPEESKLPPFIPSGSYMVELQMVYKERISATVRGYGTIWRHIV